MHRLPPLMYTICTYADERLLPQAVDARETSVNAAAEKRLVSLLTIPLDHYDVVTVLELNHYPTAMALLPPAKCKVRTTNTLCWHPLR